MADKLSKTDEAIDLEDYMLKMIKKEQRFSLSDKGLLSEVIRYIPIVSI